MLALRNGAKPVGVCATGSDSQTPFRHTARQASVCREKKCKQMQQPVEVGQDTKVNQLLAQELDGQSVIEQSKAKRLGQI